MDTGIHISARGADYLERARQMGPAVDAATDEVERIRDLPEPLFAALVEGGFFRLVMPKEYGGAELEPWAHVQVVEEFARHDASTAWCLGQNNVSATVAAYLKPEVVARIFDSPRAIVAWGPGPAQAHAVPGGYRLTGKFSFASGVRHATWLGAHVQIIEPDGSRRPGLDGQPALYTLLFPRTVTEIRNTWQVMGLRGTGSDSYDIDDLFVPEDHVIPRNGLAKPRVAGHLYTFTPSTLYCSSFAGVALGIARATLDSFIKDVRDTIPRGAKESRGHNNVVQSQVGQAEARIRSARMFLLGSLHEIWRESEGADGLTRSQQATIRLASTWAIQQAREVVTTLYMAAGALAIFESRPFERRFRDVHTVSQQIQGHASHFETVGQILLGLPPERPMFSF